MKELAFLRPGHNGFRLVCQEDAYIKEFVRYIHLNPVRSAMIRSLKELNRSLHCEHSAVMGRKFEMSPPIRHQK